MSCTKSACLFCIGRVVAPLHCPYKEEEGEKGMPCSCWLPQPSPFTGPQGELQAAG